VDEKKMYASEGAEQEEEEEGSGSDEEEDGEDHLDEEEEEEEEVDESADLEGQYLSDAEAFDNVVSLVDGDNCPFNRFCE
jgi:hypothetical protein